MSPELTPELTLAQITAFLGWCTLINLGFYLVAVIFVIGMKDWLMRTHSRMFRIDKTALPRIYMDYLARYKIAILVLNLAPYLALRLAF